MYAGVNKTTKYSLRGDSVLAIKEMPSLRGSEDDFRGNILTKYMKIFATARGYGEFKGYW